MKKEKKSGDLIGWILLVLAIIVFIMIAYAFVKNILGV